MAHLAIAEAARAQCGLERVDLVLSRVALAKEGVERPLLRHRVEVLETLAATRPWLGVVVTDRQLVADIAEGYDVVIVGADKWAQLHDLSFYGSEAKRGNALARLPQVAVAPREGFEVPDDATVLDVHVSVAPASSTAARAGAREWMAPEAAAFDAATGAWSEPARYESWLSAEG